MSLSGGRRVKGCLSYLRCNRSANCAREINCYFLLNFMTIMQLHIHTHTRTHTHAQLSKQRCKNNIAAKFLMEICIWPAGNMPAVRSRRWKREGREGRKAGITATPMDSARIACRRHLHIIKIHFVDIFSVGFLNWATAKVLHGIIERAKFLCSLRKCQETGRQSQRKSGREREREYVRQWVREVRFASIHCVRTESQFVSQCAVHVCI